MRLEGENLVLSAPEVLELRLYESCRQVLADYRLVNRVMRVPSEAAGCLLLVTNNEGDCAICRRQVLPLPGSPEAEDFEHDGIDPEDICGEDCIAGRLQLLLEPPSENEELRHRTGRRDFEFEVGGR